MANWIPLTLGRAFLEPMEIAASALLTVVDLFANLLIVLGQIIEIIALLIMGLLNALAAAINALITAIKNFLNDLLSLGFYAFPYAPITKNTAKKFSEWLEVVASSFDRKTDKHRPEFSEDAYVGALTMCVAFPTFEELIEWWKAFMALWTTGWDFDSSWPIHDDPEEDIGGDPPNPHWYSAALKDIEPVRRVLAQWIAVLDKFTLFDDINSIIQKFAQMLKRKGEQLQAFAAYTRQTILNLIKALSQTGIWVLPIYGRGGNALVQSALRNPSGEPAEIKSSAQKGAEEALAQLRNTVAQVGAIQPDTTFIAPQNNMGNWDLTKSMQADLNQHLDQLENDVRMNPQGRLTTVIDKALMSDQQKKEYEARRKAGYPDEAKYFQPVPGYTSTSDRPPNTVSTATVRGSANQTQEYLNTLTTNPDRYPLSNPNTDAVPVGTDPVSLPFRITYRIAAQTITTASADKPNKPVEIDVAGVYMEGLYQNDTESRNEILRVLAAVKEEAKAGAVVIVDLLNVRFTEGVTTTTSIDLCKLLTDYLLENYWTEASNLIFITDSTDVSGQLTDFANTLDSRKAETGAVMPGPLGPGDDSASSVMPTVRGSANDVGTRTPGDALGTAMSDMLWADAEEVSVPVPVITYDEDGHAHVRYEKKRKKLGSRFSPSNYPDFAGNNNITIGLMVLAGGPSEAPAEALFNLFGVATAAGETAGMGGVKVAETATTGASVFNNFSENAKYTRAKERAGGNTVNWP